MTRALDGTKVVWLAAAGPIPFATMLLADLGADVVRVDRADVAPQLTGLRLEDDPRTRNQRSIGVDLKAAEGMELVRDLAAAADVFIEGMRPGAAERLGLAPDDLRAGHDGLIYARMTGWGQDGPLTRSAGHDINYLSLTGALHAIGDEHAPAVPLNLVADFGGGGAYLVAGILAALVQRGRTGVGQVVDCAMVDGVASLTTLFHGLLGAGLWTEERVSNVIDGAAPYYTVYETADRRHVAVGAMEPKFYRALLEGLGMDPQAWPQGERSRWAAQRGLMAELFGTRDLAHWTAVFDGTDACVTPVLTFSESVAHDHLRARRTFVEVDDVVQPAPAPRLSASDTVLGPRAGWCAHTDQVLRELGRSDEAIAALRARNVVA